MVKVSYDSEKMHKFMVFNIILSVVLLFSVIMMTETIGEQEDQIRELARTVNELTYKFDEQSLKRPVESSAQNEQFSDNGEMMEEIWANIEYNRQ